MKRDLRILNTMNCNYDCAFCHHEGMDFTQDKLRLSIEDYIFLYETYSQQEQWNEVTISGGEPMVSREFDNLIAALAAKNAQITVVTNGSLAETHLNALKLVHQLNVSIHTTDPARYAQITGHDNLTNVVASLRKIRAACPELPIRLNVVPCANNGWSIGELRSLLCLARALQASIKLIELFPRTDPDCIPISVLDTQICQLGYHQTEERSRAIVYSSGTNNPTILLSACTCSIACTKPDAHQFCRDTHELYISPDGKLSLCRLDADTIDVYDDIKTRDADSLRTKIMAAMLRIPRRKCLAYLSQNC